MLDEAFQAMWKDGWRGKAGACALVVLVAVAAALGWAAEKMFRLLGGRVGRVRGERA